jgi:hypothetical protein
MAVYTLDAKSFGHIEVISKEANREAILPPLDQVLSPVLVSLRLLPIHKSLRELQQMIKKQRCVKPRVAPNAASNVAAMSKDPKLLLSLVQSNPDCRFRIHAE